MRCETAARKKEKKTLNADKDIRQTNTGQRYCAAAELQIYVYFSVLRIHEELFINLMCVSRRRLRRRHHRRRRRRHVE